MHTKRVVIISAIFLALFAVLGLRLAHLSLLKGESLSVMASEQRLRSLDYYQYARGDICDREGRSLTGAAQSCILVVPAMVEATLDSSAAYLANILGYDQQTVYQRLLQGNSQSSSPYVLKTGLSVEEARAVEQADLPGVLVVTLAARYDGLAAHLIGYVQPVGENGAYVGVSGLEQQYDGLLGNRVDKQVLAAVDATGALSGDHLYVQETDEVSRTDLNLTIDRDYQQIAEQAFADLGYSGACVIMDPDNGDILAAVSAPSYDQYNWESAVSDNAYINKAFSLYPPASTFKTLLAIAALEEDSALPSGDLTVPDARENPAAAANEESGTAQVNTAEADGADGDEDGAAEGIAICSGSCTLSDGRVVSCSVEGGHGEVDFDRALAVSCNCYFIALGEELGGDTIKRYFNLLGLNKLQVIGYQLPDYQASDFINFSSSLVGEVANACLGEEGIRLSPVQVASLLSCCVNGGYRVYPRLVRGAEDQDGHNLLECAGEQPEPVISAATAERVRQMLVSAVESGTASAAQGTYLACGGKTGSSETGVVWFAGFAPAEAPEWVITVCVENGTAGGREAAAVFNRIIDGIALLEGRT